MNEYVICRLCDGFQAFFTLISVGALESCAGVAPVLCMCYADAMNVLHRLFSALIMLSLHLCLL